MGEAIIFGRAAGGREAGGGAGQLLAAFLSSIAIEMPPGIGGIDGMARDVGIGGQIEPAVEIGVGGRFEPRWILHRA